MGCCTMYTVEWFRGLEMQATVTKPHVECGPQGRFPPSKYYRFLYFLAREIKPRLSVELGLCGGGASFHLATGYPSGAVIGIDIKDNYPRNREFIEQKCSNFTFWQVDSVLAARAISPYAPLDILFVDTDHTYEQTMAEWNAWEPYLSERAIVCLDDLFRKGMDKAWNEIPWPNKLRLDSLHDGGVILEDGYGDGGFGVVWR